MFFLSHKAKAMFQVIWNTTCRLTGSSLQFVPVQQTKKYQVCDLTLKVRTKQIATVTNNCPGINQIYPGIQNIKILET